TQSGEDYRKQLKSLGAILAVPGSEGRYLVIRDLNPPAKVLDEDVGKIQRIFWIGDERRSVENLSRALQLRQMPKFIVAFFPQTLEQKLRKLEREEFKGSEDQIKETWFKVVRTADGYVPEVLKVIKKGD